MFLFEKKTFVCKHTKTKQKKVVTAKLSFVRNLAYFYPKFQFLQFKIHASLMY